MIRWAGMRSGSRHGWPGRLRSPTGGRIRRSAVGTNSSGVVSQGGFDVAEGSMVMRGHGGQIEPPFSGSGAKPLLSLQVSGAHSARNALRDTRWPAVADSACMRPLRGCRATG